MKDNSILDSDIPVTASERRDEFRSERESLNPRIYVYRYVWKIKDSDDNKLQVKIVSEPLKGHQDFVRLLVESLDIVSCMREYICEYDPAFFSLVEVLKQEKENKEGEKNEKIS